MLYFNDTLEYMMFTLWFCSINSKSYQAIVSTHVDNIVYGTATISAPVTI